MLTIQECLKFLSTGCSLTSTEVDGREIGADLHIGKPFSTKDLMTDIERLLRDVSPDWTPIT